MTSQLSSLVYLPKLPKFWMFCKNVTRRRLWLTARCPGLRWRRSSSAATCPGCRDTHPQSRGHGGRSEGIWRQCEAVDSGRGPPLSYHEISAWGEERSWWARKHCAHRDVVEFILLTPGTVLQRILRLLRWVRLQDQADGGDWPGSMQPFIVTYFNCQV